MSYGESTQMPSHAQTTQVHRPLWNKGSEASNGEHKCMVVFSKAAKKEKAETPPSLFRQDHHTSRFFLRNLLAFSVEIEFEASGHLPEISGCLVAWTCGVTWSHILPLCASTLRLTPKIHGCPATHDRGMVLCSAV